MNQRNTIAVLIAFATVFIAGGPAKADHQVRYQMHMSGCLAEGYSVSFCQQIIPKVMCLEDGYSRQRCGVSPSPQQRRPRLSEDAEIRRQERRRQDNEEFFRSLEGLGQY